MAGAKERRKTFYANQFQKDILNLIFLVALLPTLIVSLCLYFLVFSVIGEDFILPFNIDPLIIAEQVSIILLFLAPGSIAIILMVVYKQTHKLIGSFDRILRELDGVIKGEKKDHIKIRQTDKFWPLISRINALIDKLHDS